MNAKWLILFVLLATWSCTAQQTDPPTEQAPPGDGAMTADRLGELLKSVDSTAQNQGSVWQFEFQQRSMVVVYDENADRIRIVTPIAPQSALDADTMLRLLQANYDSALDARYALAQEVVWGVFLHPLSPLDKEQLASAIFQVYSIAETFGSTYTSGLFTFGGGDSAAQNRKLFEELQKRLNPST